MSSQIFTPPQDAHVRSIRVQLHRWTILETSVCVFFFHCPLRWGQRGQIQCVSRLHHPVSGAETEVETSQSDHYKHRSILSHAAEGSPVRWASHRQATLRDLGLPLTHSREEMEGCRKQGESKKYETHVATAATKSMYWNSKVRLTH